MFIKKIATKAVYMLSTSSLIFCTNLTSFGGVHEQCAVVTKEPVYLMAPSNGSTVNTGTVKKIKNKTQVGIKASYKNTTKERYSHLDYEFVTVNPIYDIEYENGEKERGVVDKNTKIPSLDIDIDEYILFNRGENTFNLKQKSTGFKASFVILGADIEKKVLDDIKVIYKGDKLKVSEKVHVYDIDVIPSYKVTYDNGEVAYENDYTVDCYDFKVSPSVIEKEGMNDVKVTYAVGNPGDEDYKELTKTLRIEGVSDKAKTPSDEKKKRR